jgi:hypothetical protein
MHSFVQSLTEHYVQLDIDKMFGEIDATPKPSRPQQDSVNVQGGQPHSVLTTDELQYLNQLSSSQGFDASTVAGPPTFELPPALPQNTLRVGSQDLDRTHEFNSLMNNFDTIGTSAVNAAPMSDVNGAFDPNFMNLVIRVAFKLTMAQPLDHQESQFYAWMKLYNFDYASLLEEQDSAHLDIESMIVPMNTPQQSAVSQSSQDSCNGSSSKLALDVQVKERACRIFARAKTWSPQALNSLSPV